MNESASSIALETVSGNHELNITGYSLTKGLGVGKYITSDRFNLGGYYWNILYYPDGSDKNQTCPHISFFIKLCSFILDDVRVRFGMFLQNHNEMFSRENIKLSPATTFNLRQSEWGMQYFMKQAEFEASEYLKNDCFTIICAMDIINPSVNKVDSNCDHNKRTNKLELASNLIDHLGKLLDSEEGSDVSFQVQGKKFNAHRCILAARSPVFKAELLGSMSERNTRCIKINDIEPQTFAELLHFMYTDSLSPSFELGDVKSSFNMVQHLLVAADRYAFETLKSICEDKLCETICVETVATTLAFADQHNCTRLKLACLEFVRMPENLLEVVV